MPILIKSTLVKHDIYLHCHHLNKLVYNFSKNQYLYGSNSHSIVCVCVFFGELFLNVFFLRNANTNMGTTTYFRASKSSTGIFSLIAPPVMNLANTITFDI